MKERERERSGDRRGNRKKERDRVKERERFKEPRDDGVDYKNSTRSRRRGSCSFCLHPPSTETAVCGFMLWKCDSVGTCDFGGVFVLYYYIIRGFIIIIKFFFLSYLVRIR